MAVARASSSVAGPGSVTPKVMRLRGIGIDLAAYRHAHAKPSDALEFAQLMHHTIHIATNGPGLTEFTTDVLLPAAGKNGFTP
jgi:hypothetical protein